ncbi:MAG: Mur ligase family protein, partial [Bacteroidota bacterium]
MTHISVEETIGQPAREISSVEFDSRAVKTESLFVSVPGTQVDGHRFIAQALTQGAAVVMCERLPEERNDEVTYLKVASSQKALGLALANFYDRPAEELVMVGITGTNGKTTVATLLHQLFTQLGVRAGLVSTVKNLIGQEVKPSTHTTPDPKQLQELLRAMVEAGCEVCCMEVSSHAL